MDDGNHPLIDQHVKQGQDCSGTILASWRNNPHAASKELQEKELK